MTQYNEVFRRYEKKYLLSAPQFQALTERIKGKLKPDSFGLYTISNLYFDTDTYQIIRASLQKPTYKEKLRLRSYGTPSPGDTVFWELKKKYKGVVYKRRVPLSLYQAIRFVDTGERPEPPCQILKEIEWFLTSYRPVPKVFIAYDRIAFSGCEDTCLRVTFDSNIRWRDEELDLSKGDYGKALQDSELYVMEIKTGAALPLWLVRILSELKIYPASFSKYGMCYQKFLFKKKGAIPSA